MSIGPFELCIIFLAVILVFGTKRLPDLARNLGKGIKEFKETVSNLTDEKSHTSK